MADLGTPHLIVLAALAVTVFCLAFLLGRRVERRARPDVEANEDLLDFAKLVIKSRLRQARERQGASSGHTPAV